MIYVASPYTHSDPIVVQDRFERVEKYVAELLREGYVAFSPIIHCHGLATKYDLPKDYWFWERYCLGMLDEASSLYVLKLDGWRESVGIGGEIYYATHKAGIPVLYVEEIDV